MFTPARKRMVMRLDSAREMALWLLDQLPAGSQIAVIESRPGPAVFSVDLSAARQAVERLRLSALSEPLAVAAIRGVELLESNPLRLASRETEQPKGK